MSAARKRRRPPARALGPQAAARATIAAATRAGSGTPDVGLATVPADRFVGGYGDFVVRADLAARYRAVLAKVRALGGVLTSSGGIRDLHEKATPGRSRTSLHYTGRALDLCIDSGMHDADDPYMVVADTSGATPRWTVFCVSRDPDPSDPAYDASLLRHGTLRCAVWRKGKGLVHVERTERYFSLTDVFASEGWVSIPARGDWVTNYLSCEWWHFQHHQGLVEGVTTFGSQLLAVWPRALVEASGLALGAIWRGLSFHVGAAPVPVAPPPAADTRERERWVQEVLNAVASARLTVDGRLGTKSLAALRRFQRERGLGESAQLDGRTETALVQAALERLGHTPFPRLGTRDQMTAAAIRGFQTAAGLDVDGMVGARTRKAMVEALHRAGAARPGEPSIARAPRGATRAAGAAPSGARGHARRRARKRSR